MNNKILRYSVEAAIIYILFRYFGTRDRRLSMIQSLIATIAVLMMAIIIERLIISYIGDTESTNNNEESNILEKFDSSIGCISCDKLNNNDHKIDIDSNEAFSADSSSSSNDKSSNDANIDNIWYNGPTMHTERMRTEDDEKTNVLPIPMPSEYEHSYSFLSESPSK